LSTGKVDGIGDSIVATMDARDRLNRRGK